MASPASFHLDATDGEARAGRAETPHGAFHTPCFMAVGTQGAVKLLTPDEVRGVGIEVVLANAYHLMLRPGAQVVEALGGLARFSGWDGPTTTDSGGFQIFSQPELVRVSEEGVRFTSHIDGARVFLSPERAVEVQGAIGADLVMCLDECLPYPVERSRAAESLERTLRWAARCREAHARAGRAQALFGIVQGATYRDLREEAAERLVEIGFDGYAIGGLSVGEGPAVLREVLDWTAPRLPEGRLRYLMGAGTPEDLLAAIGLGVDLFDCVLPTRNGRSATAFTRFGRLRLRNARHARDDSPVEEGCDCPCCKRFSRGYLRHLFLAGEGTAGALLSLHNLRFYARLMHEARRAICGSRFASFCREFLAGLASGGSAGE